MLKEFQPGLSQGIYEALAWEGLIGTVAWDALSEPNKNLQQTLLTLTITVARIVIKTINYENIIIYFIIYFIKLRRKLSKHM
jgi:hypothetical protein